MTAEVPMNLLCSSLATTWAARRAVVGEQMDDRMRLEKDRLRIVWTCPRDDIMIKFISMCYKMVNVCVMSISQ